MATIDDNLANAITEALRQAQIDISNQDKFLVGPGDVTLTRADGTTFTGPSLPKMAGITSSAMQWRGGIPASSNLNNFGPTSAYTGVWGQSSVSVNAADLANGYPAAERGVLEVFAGGRNNGTQRYTTDFGRVFIRWLTASWNATSPAWSGWSEVGYQPASAYADDLDTMMTAGTFPCRAATTNKPPSVTQGGWVFIIGHIAAGNVLQIYHTATNTSGQQDRRFTRTYNGTSWTPWKLLGGTDALNDIGLSMATQTTAPPFDWQQVDFVTGQNYLVNVSTWTNAPADLKNPSGDVVNISCELARNTSNRFAVRVVSQSTTAAARYEYYVVINGAKGSRTFSVAQEFNSDPTTVVPIANGGTGSNTQAGAQTNLGLVKQTATTDSTAGRIMTVGAFGVGTMSPITTSLDITQPCGFWTTKAALGGIDNNASMINLGLDTNVQYQVIIPTIMAAAPRMYLRVRTATAQYNGQICEVYTTTNTTKAADGTLKAASPVVKIFADGTAETNDESEGVTVTRQEEGVYLITGCLGLNADAAWGGIDGGFDIPKDRNRQPLIWLDYKVNPDGSVLVKTYHRTHPGAPEFARNERQGFNEGDPIDIPADQYVSIRVEMPVDSIYNKKLEEAARMLAEQEAARKLAEEEAARVKAEQERLDAEAAANSEELPDVQQ